jgi:hypothetical protein
VFGRAAPSADVPLPLNVLELLNFNAALPLDTGLITLDDAKNPPKESCTLGSILPFAKPSVFYGPSGIGKSAWIAGLVFHVAAGLPEFLGMKIHRVGGAVLVYTAEDSIDDWKRKAAAVLAADPTFPIERALRQVHVHEVREGFARLSEEVTIRKGSGDYAETRRERRPTEERNRIVATARQLAVQLIVVETTSRIVDDEDNATFSTLISDLGHIARVADAAVLLTHHPSKSASTYGDRSPEAARGGYALIANARNAISLFGVTQKEAEQFGPIFKQDELAVLEQQKTTSSIRKQQPIVLVRKSTDHGLVFGFAGMREDSSTAASRVAAKDELAEKLLRQQRGERLRTVVAQLVADGEAPSERRLRDFLERLSIPKGKLPQAVKDAKDDGYLCQGPKARGLYLTLLPSAGDPLAHAAQVNPCTEPLGPEVAQVASPLGGPAARAASETEVAQVARSGPDAEDMGSGR